MTSFDDLNRRGLAMLADPETLIADRVGANSMYANDPAKLRACNKWVDHARPIIKAMFVLEDAADGPLLSALVEAGKGGSIRRPVTWQERNYRDARDEIKKARRALYDMLDGIRDNFICDEMAGQSDDPDEQEEADAYNDWLAESTVSVDAAIRAVAREYEA